jgi:hypothetical protein
MTSPAGLARPSRTTQPHIPPRDFLASVTSAGSGLPSRVLMHAVEGFGQSRGETGLETLIDAGQVPETPHFPQMETWEEAIGAVTQLLNTEHPYRTFVLDTLNGLERLCHEHICRREFQGDWSDKGFMGYMRGYEVSLADWREFLSLLDRLRSEKRMSIVCLVHTKVARFSNPEGADYDRYSPDMHAKTWGLTQRWADMVLFGNFHTVAAKDSASGGKVKGRGGTERVLYTERTAAFDAKNRVGLPSELPFGPDAATAWSTFSNALKAAKTASNGNGADAEKGVA